MWLVVVSIAYGVLVALDPILFIFIGYTQNVSGIYLGLLGAIWSIVYVVANKLLNRFADEGYNKLLMLISLTCLTISYIGFIAINHLTAILLYAMHAVSTASMNLAISVTMLENIDSGMWSTASVVQRSISSLSRGAALLLISLIGILTPSILFWLLFSLTTISIILLPPILLSFERRFYKLDRGIGGIGMYIKASSSILFLDKPDIARYIYIATWNSRAVLPLYRILISIAIATALGDYIFTVLPLLLRNYISLYSMWMAYGIAALLSAIMIVVFRNLSISRRSFTLSIMVLRTSILILGLNAVKDLTTLAIYILLSSLLYMLIDITLYNMFIEGSAGFSTAHYFMSREIGSIIGSLIGGIIVGFGGNVFLMIAGAIGFIAVLTLI